MSQAPEVLDTINQDKMPITHFTLNDYDIYEKVNNTKLINS